METRMNSLSARSKVMDNWRSSWESIDSRPNIPIDDQQMSRLQKVNKSDKKVKHLRKLDSKSVPINRDNSIVRQIIPILFNNKNKNKKNKSKDSSKDSLNEEKVVKQLPKQVNTQLTQNPAEEPIEESTEEMAEHSVEEVKEMEEVISRVCAVTKPIDLDKTCIRADCQTKVSRFYLYEGLYCSANCAVKQWTDNFHTVWTL